MRVRTDAGSGGGARHSPAPRGFFLEAAQILLCSIESFYDLNYNHPPSRLSQLQAFNFTANKWSLASATASIQSAPAPVGFRVDVGMGRIYDAFWLSETSHDGWSRHLLNAYVSVKPASWKGLQFDFGKFVTSAGAEVTGSRLNWKDSRSLLFAFGPVLPHRAARFAVGR